MIDTIEIGAIVREKEFGNLIGSSFQDRPRMVWADWNGPRYTKLDNMTISL